MGSRVDWDANAQTVIIQSAEIAEVVEINEAIAIISQEGQAVAWAASNPLHDAIYVILEDGSLLTMGGELEMENMKQVRTGNSHTLAIDSEGTLWTWGDNMVGALGDALGVG
ncbi:MAG: hypothetical protein FWE27_08135 [Defluviitaleaceae bacterium]|nr:hypothetical protein [Defluviitaleaceae bacterium]